MSPVPALCLTCQLLSQFASELDRLAPGVCFVATAPSTAAIDTALLRPGRFEEVRLCLLESITVSLCLSVSHGLPNFSATLPLYVCAHLPAPPLIHPHTHTNSFSCPISLSIHPAASACM